MLRQINFRIDTDLVDRLDVRAKEMSLDRSAIIKLAINQLLSTPLEAPARPLATQLPPTTDHEARTALEKLLGRLKTIEQDVEHLKRIQAEKSEPKASFSDLF